MTYDEHNDYKNGERAGHAYMRTWGLSSAQRAFPKTESKDYQAGYVDAMLEHVQTREELAPGCYRIRPLKGQD